MKNTGWIILSMALVIAILGFLQYKSCTFIPDELPVAKTDSAVRWETKDSLFVTSLLTEKDQEYSNLDKHYRDSISALIAIGDKKDRATEKHINELLYALTSAEAELHAVDKPEITYEEPVKDCPPVPKTITQHYKNQWYDIVATAATNPIWGRAVIKTKDTLIVKRSTKTTGNFFNQKQYEQLDISFLNPYNVVSGIRSFTIAQPKEKRFGIGIFAGYGYSLDKDLQRAPVVAIGVSYNLIRF